MSVAGDHVEALKGDGWEVVQEGRVAIPYVAKYPKPSFVERVEGFNFGKFRDGDKLFDDDEHWWHLRKGRVK